MQEYKENLTLDTSPSEYEAYKKTTQEYETMIVEKYADATREIKALRKELDEARIALFRYQVEKMPKDFIQIIANKYFAKYPNKEK